MCFRYILAAELPVIETRFGLPPQNLTMEPEYNISPGRYVPVITCDKPYELQLFKFGLTPFWAKSEMNLFNARAEGDSNADDNPGFHGSKGIILKKAFRKPVRSQRCLIPASAFIAGATGQGNPKPYLVYLRQHHNPFAFAGIFDTWFNPSTGDYLNAFSIITTTANSLLRSIGSSRMPVILTDHQAKKWINPITELSVVTGMLRHYDSKRMNAYPIDLKILTSDENSRQLILPVGAKVYTEDEPATQIKINTSSHWHSKKAQSGQPARASMLERAELSSPGRKW